MDDYRADLKALMDETLLLMPGVTTGKSFGYPAYKINGKVFMFVGGAGIGLKLPRERVLDLIDANETMHPFEPVEGRVWKAWVSIDLEDTNAYSEHEALYEESVAFVGGI